MKKYTLFACIAVLALVTVVMVGCLTQSTMASLIGVLGNATASIASIEGNTALATQIKTDTAAASAAVLDWNSGTPAQDAIEDLNIVEDDLNLIPMSGAYVALVDLGIGTIESILAMLPASTTTVSVERAHKRRSVTPVHVTKWGDSSREFKNRWNKIVATDGSLAPVAIK
jgi:hypothetical protein